MMTLLELSRIDRTIDIAATPERVWRALSTSEELSAWFQVTIEGALAPGQQVWMTSQHPGYVGQRFLVRVVEMTPSRRLVWQWHPGELDSTLDYSREPMTTVTFTLEAIDGGTRLSVAETGFDEIALERRAKVHKDNAQGWAEVLVWVKTHVEASHVETR
jgi:uncharacterized protein YndB with AHSA1/START domain